MPTFEQCHLTSEQSGTSYLQYNLSPCQECALRIESSFAVAISAEVGLPRHMQNQFFVQIVYSDRSLGSDCVHCASGNHPHFTTLFHILSTLRWCMCYLRPPLKHSVYTVVMCLWQDLMSCVAVHSSGCVWPHHVSFQHVQLQTWCGLGTCAHLLAWYCLIGVYQFVV